MSSPPLAHICLLVKDLDKAIEDWTKILSVLDPAQLDEPLVRYEEFESGTDQVRAATFAATKSTQIQLTQPAPGTPMAERLTQHGEFVHHICFVTDDVPAAATRLADLGLDVDAENLYSDPLTPWQEWTWLRRASAHGVSVEIARPYRAVDGKWAPPAGTDPR
jgi:methylmalonyl-CoA/ethylmalonyl-CoA epimerase